jgi:hypothetical protein
MKTPSANFVGNAVAAIDPGSASSLDAVVKQIQQQMMARRRYLGLAVSFFPVEALPGVKHLVGLIPFGLIKKQWQRKERSQLLQDHIPGVILLSNAGELDADRLAFRGVDLVDAYATAGVFKIPGLMAIGVGGFRGSLTLHLGCGRASVLSRVSERMMQVLPLSSSVDRG